jgi:Tfp pilus assembly protein FimT
MGCRASASSDTGFSLVELLATMLVLVTLSGLVMVVAGNMAGHYRLSGDARGVSNAVAVAKLRAASLFTQTRLYVTLSTGSYHVETWQKTGTPGWVTEGGTTTLSPGVTFGSSAVTVPPPNTQATLAQAPPCLDNAGAAIGDSACIVYNSRGLPVDASGAPTAIDAFYLTDGVAVYAATVSATGMMRVWRTAAHTTPTWVLQ